MPKFTVVRMVEMTTTEIETCEVDAADEDAALAIAKSDPDADWIDQGNWSDEPDAGKSLWGTFEGPCPEDEEDLHEKISEHVIDNEWEN